MTHESVVSIAEHDLVDRLYSDIRLFHHIALPPHTPWPCSIHLRVPFTYLVPGAEAGDVDSLLVPRDKPHESRAVEFKRVLMSTGTFRGRSPNKLQELTKAVRQANRLADFGFACVWLSVLVVADSREANQGPGYLAPTGEMMRYVYDAIPVTTLDRRVGLVVYEITQCFDQPIGLSGMMGGHLVREGQSQTQPASLTDAIVRLTAT